MGLYFPYLLFVVLIGIWAAKLDRSVLIFVLVGVVLSPVVAGIILLILGNNNPKCPSCKGYVDPTASKCKNCGDPLPYTLPGGRGTSN